MRWLPDYALNSWDEIAKAATITVLSAAGAVIVGLGGRANAVTFVLLAASLFLTLVHIGWQSVCLVLKRDRSFSRRSAPAFYAGQASWIAMALTLWISVFLGR